MKRAKETGVVSNENRELRDAVQSLTIELKKKNRELEIEAALEKVRIKAMAMYRSEDLNDATAAVFDQLRLLNLGVLRCGIGIMNKEKRSADVWVTTITAEGCLVQVSGDESVDVHPLLQGVFETWLKNEDFSYILKGDDMILYYQTQGGTNFHLPESQLVLSKPHENYRQYCYAAMFESGALFAFHENEFAEETKQVLKRFAGVFNLTYRRFLDIQKAESQAREAQIQASLERVRTVAMAMNTDDNLVIVCEALYKELKQLGLENIRNAQAGIIDAEKKIYKEYSYSYSGLSSIGNLTKYSEDPLSNELVREMQKSKDAFFKKQLSGEEFENWRKWRSTQLAFRYDLLLETTSSIWFYYYSVGSGGIGISTFESITEDQQQLLKRFRNVFELSYQRFLDLRQAGAQAREAQIEAALERIRAAAMAMHKSDDLHAAVTIMFEEFQKLNLNVLRCGVGILNKESRTGTVWTTSVSDDEHAVQISANERFDTNPLMMLIYESWQKQEDLAYVLQGQDLINYYKAMQASEFKLPGSQIVSSEEQLKTQYYYAAMFDAGGLYAFRDTTFTEEDIKIMKRFAAGLNLTYNRFLDLQKAEAQAREAKIEASLERVRAKAMAMHNSEDLAITVDTFFSELKSLKVVPRRCGATLIDEETHIADLTVTTATREGETKKISAKLKLSGHHVLEGVYDNWKQQKDFFPVLVGQEIKDYYQVMNPQIEYPDFTNDQKQYGYYFFFKEGGVFAWTEKLLLEEEIQIFRKFTSVLSLTYKRYQDLQKAEAQAREAKIEAALERVRTRTMAMQKSDELSETAAVLFQEFKELGDHPMQIGIGTINEVEGTVEMRITDWSGSGSQVNRPFNLSLEEPTLISKEFKAWKEHKSSIVIDLTGKQLENWINYRNRIYGIPVRTEDIEGRRVVSCAFFSQGWLNISTVKPPSKKTIQLLERFAGVFDLTYTRFLDLQTAEEQAEQARLHLIQIEAEKLRAELALHELQATQKQLIHSEKMASLGELTAGIAHEIQNPLNFVNNFSEVSIELSEELKSEVGRLQMGDGNKTVLLALIDDIINNQSKITHHGKRADSIVKGMLQHSRASSGQKEPTDINALADEYIRLSYHGMRAKDKSFNAGFETQLDESIEKLNVIPQEIGRVLLNLFNNAFYSVSEKKKQLQNNYDPKVRVTTKKENGHVLIKIADNGSGIGPKVLDKIFQPFFTTKPTGQGTGLGLSLSYDIIKAHGGEMNVETKEGEGAEFTIIIKNG